MVSCFLASIVRRADQSLESCLVEVARRECNKEGSHGSPKSAEAKQTKMPCADHYQQIKDQYGKYLDNLGCICKILLSLNIESCCIIPSHSPAKLSSRSPLKTPTKSTHLKSNRMQQTDDYSCSTADASAKPVPMPSDKSSNECGENCCTSEGKSKDESQASQKSTQEYFKREDSGLGKIIITASEKEPAMKSCGNNDCCDEARNEPFLTTATLHSQTGNDAERTGAGGISTADIYTCSGKDCCSIDATDIVTKLPKQRCCTPDHGSHEKQKHAHHEQHHGLSKLFAKRGKDCCSSDPAFKPSFELANRDSTPDDSNIDLEDLPAPLHLLIQVQGLDCTSCETKLFRSLEGLREVKNIKISLMLAQAEFDLFPSTRVHKKNILQMMEKVSGCICTFLNTGADLELLVVGNPEAFSAEEKWPKGVNDIIVVSKTKINVSYSPGTVGARDLLANPFFSQATLAPTSAPPVIASGRAQVRKLSWKTFISILLTIPVLILTWARLPPNPVRYGAASLTLATLVQFGIAGHFYISAFKSLFFSRMLDMDLLIVLSSTTAYVYSVVAFGYLAGQFFLHAIVLYRY